MSSELIQNSKFKIQNFLAKPFLFLLLGLVAYFSFGLSQITKYSTADEHFWLPNYGSERVQAYWRAIAEGDWEDTRINDKPGVSIALVSGIAIPLTQNAIHTQIPFDDGTVKRFNPSATETINFFFRFPLLLFNGLFVFYFFWILKKILRNEWVVLWACLFILLSPVILGISQIVNPDTLFWSFGAATMLTFYAYLQTRSWRFVWLATLFFGFTLLSKYVGIIFFPFFFVMILIRFLFSRRDALPCVSTTEIAERIKKDLLAYAVVMFGGVLLFALLMPAAIVDPKVLWESTIGFPGMLPIFIALLLFGALLLADAILLKSRTLSLVLSFLAPKKVILEKVVYAILFCAVMFTLLNWMSRNSLVDLSGISFDEKTKASFTTDNPYLARFVAEWVPLVFALTPLTLLFLVFSWAQAFFGALQKRALVFTLSVFFLVFYAAVLEQGLLVTVRYSILLFPLAAILAALSIRSFLFPKTDRERFFTRLVAPTLAVFFSIFYGVLTIHDAISLARKIAFENFLGNHLFLLGVALVGILWGFVFLWKKIVTRLRLPRFSLTLVSGIILLLGVHSLWASFPHPFLYTNSLLPERYLLFHAWGYGGYEAAQYLNKKPNAENLTLWTDSYGVCEFFVGNCIKKQKVNVEKYPIDYLMRTLRGQVSPKFKYHLEGKPEWDYAVGGRKKNFIRLFRNTEE